ncbi:MAG TPA: carboxypeptidase regulatory-like domain-containing protein [Candidatus Brocadiia bacterium]|nr:carboxypeptidase regulatory-like domain-containing protein [Planctomycetota bacterium]MBI4007557.1 carboxypeptidase regulatory-like domain-containing protein [Planctomycetota bacterium]MDO8094390.1 carboxypeptidase regulatory-like domain-containing protein [Candidatus Brocadiales bacterium]
MKGLYGIALGMGLTLGVIGSSGTLVKSYGYTEMDVAQGGTITGTVTFEGDMPAPKLLKVDKDLETCGHHEMFSEELIISKDTKGIKNVIVSIEGIEKGKKFIPPSSNPALDQKECTYIPHVLAISAGTTVDILNSDKVLHNVHSYAIKNSPFNEGVSTGGKLPKKFEFPELVPIKCDLHKWMSAFIVIKDNPYFVMTDDNGSFKIDNVPAGTYKLQAWQEKLGKQVQDVTIEAGKEVKVDFQLKPKGK